MTHVSRGQRWVSRHDQSIVVTVQRKTATGLWAVTAPSDRVEELISAERLGAEYRLLDEQRATRR